MSSVSIVHAHLVLPGRDPRRWRVLVRDGKIVAVGPCREVPWSDADEAIDAGSTACT